MIPRMKINPPPDVNFPFAVAALMRGVAEFCYRRAQPVPDLVPWPDQDRYCIGRFVALEVRQPKPREPAVLIVRMALLSKGRGPPAEWTITADELARFTAGAADHLLRDLFFEITDGGLRHPIPALRRRVALFDPFPRLPESALPLGTRVRIKHFNIHFLPHANRLGTVLAELDQSKMALVYVWLKQPPQHVYLIEVEHGKSDPDQDVIKDGKQEVAYGDNEFFVQGCPGWRD